MDPRLVRAEISSHSRRQFDTERQHRNPVTQGKNITTVYLNEYSSVIAIFKQKSGNNLEKASVRERAKECQAFMRSNDTIKLMFP